MSTIRQALLDRILYVGGKVPTDLMEDERPKFILLGTPQQFMDDVTELEP